MSDIDRQRDHFSAVASQYIDARKSHNHQFLKLLIWDYLFTRPSLATIFPKGRATTVFEPMCGCGESYEILKRYVPAGLIYSGSDISKPMVEEAKARYPEVTFTVGDATQEFGTDQFDLIIIVGGLHHVFRHLPNVLKNVNRALHAGGVFVNLEPTEGNRVFTFVRNYIYRTNSLFDAETERGFGLPEINEFYRAAGFEVVEQIYPGLSSYILYYNPDAFPALNRGPKWLVSGLFSLDKLLMHRSVGGFLSFATLTVLRKAGG